jgi:hypothetical protein
MTEAIVTETAAIKALVRQVDLLTQIVSNHNDSLEAVRKVLEQHIKNGDHHHHQGQPY